MTPEPAWMTFRRQVIDVYWDNRRFGYIDHNRFVGTCPSCEEAAVVRFAGRTTRATVDCESDCSQAEIDAAARRRSKRR